MPTESTSSNVGWSLRPRLDSRWITGIGFWGVPAMFGERLHGVELCSDIAGNGLELAQRLLIAASRRPHGMRSIATNTCSLPLVCSRWARLIWRQPSG